MSEIKTINRRHIKLRSFTSEIPEDLDSTKRLYVTVEADFESIEEFDNHDGTFDRIFKSKVVGSTVIKQDGSKPIIGKSKRSQSKKIRAKCWGQDPSEEYYEKFTNGVLEHFDEILKLLNL